MRFRSGTILAVAAGVIALAGCASGAGGSGGPASSPTGKVYEPGIAPSQTQFSRNATIALAQGQYEQALAQAQQGIAADSTNPVHFYIAGDAAVGMGNFALADSLWKEAERLYPAYELEIEPSRESAWANAFNEGVEAYNAGDVDEAIAQWRGAHLIYSLRPQAAQNLAILLMQEGEYNEAIQVLQEGIAATDLLPATRVLEEEEIAERETARLEMLENLATLLAFTDQYDAAEPVLRQLLEADPDNVKAQADLATALTRQGRESEAAEIYTRLLSMRDLPAAEFFNIGVALFNAQDYARAAEAFTRVTELQPSSRDAWYNRANAHYAAEDYTAVIPAAERLLEIDPLNSDGALILAQSYREMERQQDALAALERLQALPVYVADTQLQSGSDSSELRGQIVGNQASPGTPIRLQFTFYNDDGQVGTSTVTVNAPAAEQRQTFSVTVDGFANAFSYQLMQ